MALCERVAGGSSLLWPRVLLFGDSITQVLTAPSAASARVGRARCGFPSCSAGRGPSRAGVDVPGARDRVFSEGL